MKNLKSNGGSKDNPYRERANDLRSKQARDTKYGVETGLHQQLIRRFDELAKEADDKQEPDTDDFPKAFWAIPPFIEQVFSSAVLAEAPDDLVNGFRELLRRSLAGEFNSDAGLTQFGALYRAIAPTDSPQEPETPDLATGPKWIPVSQAIRRGFHTS